jgi:hypothetical protein
MVDEPVDPSVDRADPAAEQEQRLRHRMELEF